MKKIQLLDLINDFEQVFPIYILKIKNDVVIAAYYFLIRKLK